MAAGSILGNAQPTFSPPPLAAPSGTPNAPVVIMVPATNSPLETDYSKIFPKTTVVLLGILQFILGFLAVITQIVCLVQDYHGYSWISNGIWCGLIFKLSGGFSIWAGCRPSKCAIITQLVFSIVAAAFCLPQLIFAGIGIAIHEYRYYTQVIMAMYCIQLIASLIEAGIAIAASALACRAMCCSSGRKGAVYYAASGIGNPADNNFVPFGQAPAGYITVPVHSSSMTSIPMTETAIRQSNTESEDVSTSGSPPPKY